MRFKRKHRKSTCCARIPAHQNLVIERLMYPLMQVFDPIGYPTKVGYCPQRRSPILTQSAFGKWTTNTRCLPHYPILKTTMCSARANKPIRKATKGTKTMSKLNRNAITNARNTTKVEETRPRCQPTFWSHSHLAEFGIDSSVVSTVDLGAEVWVEPRVELCVE